ncbi:MAG: response regulator [Alphaproteobacteria bacterium]|nr:response regulator [Alphaproteobacteria bacterium]
MADNGLVHLIDDDEDVRRSLAFLLGTAGMAVLVYESADAFLEQYAPGQRACVVSDVRMPGMDGLELLRRLRARDAAVPVIIMTGHADVPLAVEAMKEGAIDFIEKPFSDEVLLGAIRAAHTRLIRSEATDATALKFRARLNSLSERELQVLDGLLAGNPNKTIAYDLGISPRTVEVHRAHVMTKTGVSSLSELVRLCLLTGRMPGTCAGSRRTGEG